MANEKILQTRIMNKVDTLENWSKSTLKIKKGEICFATVAASAGTALEEPVVMVKIGTDEEKTFAELPWSFYAKSSDVLAACKSEAGLTAFINNVIASNGDISALTGRVDDIEDAIETLNGDESTAGSVAKAIKDAIDALDLSNTYAAKSHTHEISEVTGLQDALDAKVDSVTAGDASVTIGGTDADPTVAVKLSAAEGNAIELAEDGLKVIIPAADEYSIAKAADSGDYAAVYNLTKNGEVVGTSINIPKDMVVQSGEVVENPTEDRQGTYIKLVLQNVVEPLYINVGDLIEYVTSGSNTGDMVVVNVSEDHKVTATITDGTVTLAKLEESVRTEIAKAHTHENSDVLAGITADDVSAWDTAEQNAKDYADGLVAGLDSSVAATAETDNKVSVLTGVTQEDGKLTGKTEVTLAAIAKTGSTDDLVQGALTLVFDCGSSSELVD